MPSFSSKTESVEQVVDRLFKEKRSDLLDTELQRFDPHKLHGKEKECWYLYWGISAFRKNDRPEAFRRFSEGYAACPDSDQICFSLAQEYEAKSAPDKMVELFRRCRFPQVSSRHLLTASHYCYLWGLIEDARNVLEPILEACFKLGVADDHFLYVRGLPFFGQTWSYCLCYAVLRGDFHELTELTQLAKAKLSDYDFDRLFVMLRCCQAGSFAEKVAELEAFLETADRRFPQGYALTQLVSLKSLLMNEPRAAEELLNGVKFGTNDFPWLPDVLELHRARIAHLSGDLMKEAGLLEKFDEKQPRLFEPDHAVNFGLLQYQEEIKQRYQKKIAQR